ncbi:MAG: LysR substrate-binding domain-containing protein [Pseudomonadota bacterium]
MSDLRYLRALQAFDRAASHSNLSKAAQDLGVTHGAVSRQIKQLEVYLGVHLLRRRSKGVELTDAGAQLYRSTRQAFAVLQTGVSGVKRASNRQAVTISLSSSLATKWLVPRLPAFRAARPGIALFLDTNDDIIDFEDSDVDVALRYGVPDWPGLYHECLVDEVLVVVASPALVAKENLPMAPAAIVRLPLLHDQFDPAWGAWVDDLGLDRSSVAAADLKYRDSAVLIAAAIDGQGVALVRELLVHDDLAAGRLVRLDSTRLSRDRALFFVCRNGDEERVLTRALRNWLVSLSETPEK